MSTFLIQVDGGGDWGPDVARVAIDEAAAKRYLALCAEGERLGIAWGYGCAFAKVADPGPEEWLHGRYQDDEQHDDLLDQIWNGEVVETDRPLKDEEIDVDGVFVEANHSGIVWTGYWGDTRVTTAEIPIDTLKRIVEGS